MQARAWIEIGPDRFVEAGAVMTSPEYSREATVILLEQLRGLLGGLGAVLGRDVVLDLCREAVDND